MDEASTRPPGSFQRKNNGLPGHSLGGTASGQEAGMAADLHFRCFFAGNYREAVMDAYSRLIVGWSIAEHMRTELVTDALGMAIIHRQPDKRPGNNRTILHSDHGCQYTSWAFGQRLRASGLLASMGTIGDCYDNAMMESFWGTMQLELLDTKAWQTRDELANAIFEWIECWYNPKRRHSSIGMHSPVTYETLHTRSDQDH